MNAPAPTTWSGALRSIRKPELKALATQLGIAIPTDEHLRVSYETHIRAHLLSSPHLQSDPRFTNLYPSLVHDPPHHPSHPSHPSHRSSHSAPSSQASTAQDPTYVPPGPGQEGSGSIVRMPPKTPRATRTAGRKRSVAGTASGDEEGVAARAVETLERVEHEFESTLDRALVAVDRPQIGALVRRSSRRVSQKLTSVAEGVGDVAVDGLVEAQHTLSSPWVLLSLGVLAEVVYVLFSVIPLTHTTYPPLKWLIYNFTSPHRPLTIHHPDLRVLLTSQFLLPLSTYISLTLVLPLFLALLISFPSTNPNHPSSGHVLRSGRNYAFTTGSRTPLAPPNAFTFAVLRLTVVSLLHAIVFKGERGGYAYGWEGGRFGLRGLAGVGMVGGNGLEALGGVQMVGCAAAVALTLYEKVAG